MSLVRSGGLTAKVCRMAEVARGEAEEGGKEEETGSAKVSGLGPSVGGTGEHRRLQLRGKLVCIIPLGWVP